MSKIIGKILIECESVTAMAAAVHDGGMNVCVDGINSKSLANSLAECEGFEDQDLALVLAEYMKRHDEPLEAVFLRLSKLTCELLENDDE